MSESLAKKRALIVGASSGIGRQITLLFARDGASVMAAARRENRLRELKDSLLKEGHRIEIATADASKLKDMENLAERTREVLGAIDILVYATGTNTPHRAMRNLKPEIWNELIQVNLNGAYYVTQAVLPAMREARSGHLIYIASISGLYVDQSGAAYQASKRGMVALAHTLRYEERENGIRTSAVCPGIVDTELLEKRPVRPDAATLAKALQPQDIAEIVLAIAKLPERATVPEVQIMPTYI